MALGKILWADDEIENLQSQRLFLESKGYEVQTFTNGFDAIAFVKDNVVDVVLLDESMPGITGLETLAKIKEINPTVPVVMITKNETEKPDGRSHRQPDNRLPDKARKPEPGAAFAEKNIRQQAACGRENNAAISAAIPQFIYGFKQQSKLYRMDGHL